MILPEGEGMTHLIKLALAPVEGAGGLFVARCADPSGWDWLVCE